MNFKAIAIFVSGAVVGAVASYFFTKEKIEKRAQEDISAMEKIFKDKYAPDEDNSESENAQGDISEKTPEPEKEEPVAKTKHAINYGRFEQAKQKILYNKPLKYNDSNDTKAVRRKGNTMEPYVINEEEYIEMQNEDWEAMEVNFDPAAANNMYFYDNNGNEVSIDSVGNDALAYLNDADPDEVVYVRNDEIQMVFEITFDGVIPDSEDE
jgi:hypothetical protein